MRTLLKLLQPKKRTLSFEKTNRMVAWTTSVCAALVLLLPLVFNFSCKAAPGGKNNIYKMCETITSGTGNQLQGAYDAYDYQISDDRLTTYGKMIRYCTGAGTYFMYKSGPQESSRVTIAKSMSTFTAALKCVAELIFMARVVAMVMQKVIDGQDPIETWLLCAVRIGVGGAIIMNADKLVAVLCTICCWLGSTVSGGSTDSAKSALALYKTIGLKASYDQEPGLFEGITATVSVLVPWVFAWIIQLATNFIIIQTIFEIGVRRVFLPLPIADTYQEGLRSPGVRYIKKLMASIIKLVICSVIIALSARLVTLTGDAAKQTGDFVAQAGTYILVGLTSLGLMFKGGEVANDVLGV